VGSEEEIAHIRRLYQETRKRRDELEIQAARFGPSRVPAEIAIELRESEESLSRLDAKLRIVTVPQNIQDATGPEASIDVLRLAVKDLRDQVGTVWRWTEHMMLEMREESRVYREEQTRARERGQRERRIIEALFFAGLVIALVLAMR
jgi:hypothetical protein